MQVGVIGKHGLEAIERNMNFELHRRRNAHRIESNDTFDASVVAVTSSIVLPARSLIPETINAISP